MSLAPLPSSLEHAGDRRFSFYPPILNIEHNEWRFRSSTWSEIQVTNTKTGADLWVPRRYVGEVSRVDEPVMIVGLLKELEYKAGQVWLHERRVIAIPQTSHEPVLAGNEEQPESALAAAPPPGMSMSMSMSATPTTESRIGRLLAVMVSIGVVVCVLFIAVYRGILAGSRVHYATVLQGSYGLTAKDDYWSVAHRFGKPVEDRWQADRSAMQFRVLRFQNPPIDVILMGTEQNDLARYIGALNAKGQVVDSVELADGRNTQALLRALAASLEAKH